MSNRKDWVVDSDRITTMALLFGMLALTVFIVASLRSIVHQHFLPPKVNGLDIFGGIVVAAVCISFSIEAGPKRLRISLLLIAGIEGVRVAASILQASSNTWIFIVAGCLLS